MNKMKINKKKIIESFLVTGILVVMLSSLVSAIGVGCAYSGSELPLDMYPGEEKTVILSLQNWDIEDEITLEGEILKGGEIAFLKESTAKVPYREKGIYVKMIVKIPGDVSVGKMYNIEYKFKQVAGGEQEGGMITFAQGIKRNFDIIVVQKPSEEKPAGIGTGWILLIIILIVVVIAVIYFIAKKKTSVEPVKK